MLGLHLLSPHHPDSQPSQQRMREVGPCLTEILESEWSHIPVALSPPLIENLLFGGSKHGLRQGARTS